MPFTIPASNKVQGQAGFMTDIDALYGAVAALAGVNVQNSAYAGGAMGNGVVDDTVAIQAAEDTAAATGAPVVFPAGTYKVSGLVKRSNTSWIGAGRGSTIIKLANGVSAPLLISDSFASLSLSGSNTAGVTGFAIRDVTFDGNAANQSAAAAAGVQLFGYDYLLENVSIRNFLAKDGLYTEWGPSGQPGPEGGMEAHYRMLRIHGNTLTGAGWHNRGPHDSHIFGCFIYQNTANAYGYWPESSGTYTATGLSGTAVSSTPATITVNTTLGLNASGSFTVPSAGGTVTITYTGVTATTFTGCTASGGSGNYTSNTITPPQYSAVAALISQMHVWGNHSIAMVLDSESHLSNCEAEGAITGQVLARAGNITWDGGRIFLAGQPGYGLQLGDAVNTVTGFALNNPVISGFQGGSAANAAINIVATASGSYRAQIFQANSNQAIYGTFQPYEPRRIAWGGTVTPAVTAAAGAGTSPPPPTLSNASDDRGVVNMGTGTSPGAGSQALITFAQPKPGSAAIVLTPANAAAAALQPYVTGNSTTGFNIAFAVAPAASQAAGTYLVGYVAKTD